MTARLRALLLLSLSAALLRPRPVRAESLESAAPVRRELSPLAQSSVDFHVIDPAVSGPLLSPALVEEPSSYLRLAVGAEHFGNGFAGSDYLLVLSAILRHRAFGPNATLSAKPRLGTSGYEESRWLFGLGLRGYLPLLGTEVAYGIGLQAELRFEEHFWLAHATPIELSAVIYRKRTFEIELSVGMRVAMAGQLIDSFLIDPNGYHNEEAAQRLSRAKHEDAAQGFVRLVFSRRLD